MRRRSLVPLLLIVVLAASLAAWLALRDGEGDPGAGEITRAPEEQHVPPSLRGSPEAPSLERLPGPVVLVAGDLSPSEAAELDWDKVLAVATDVGSSTYHTAIIARSLGIPAVVGLKDATRRTPAGSLVVVDGTRGEVLVDPTEETLSELRTIQEADRLEDDRLRATRELPART